MLVIVEKTQCGIHNEHSTLENMKENEGDNTVKTAATYIMNQLF